MAFLTVHPDCLLVWFSPANFPAISLFSHWSDYSFYEWYLEKMNKKEKKKILKKLIFFFEPLLFFSLSSCFTGFGIAVAEFWTLRSAFIPSKKAYCIASDWYWDKIDNGWVNRAFERRQISKFERTEDIRSMRSFKRREGA